MRKVSVIAKIFPRDRNDIERIQNTISKEMQVVDAKVEDIGFGIHVLRVMLIVPEEIGDIEERLKKFPGVSEVQIESIDLI